MITGDSSQNLVTDLKYRVALLETQVKALGDVNFERNKSIKLLEQELNRQYFWCKVKLNTYAAFLFGLILYFELGY